MNDKTILNVKMDKKLKAEAQALAQELGIPLSTIVNAGLKDFVRSRSFTVSALPRLRPEIERELAEIDEDIKHGRNLSPVFDNAEDLSKYLRNL